MNEILKTAKNCRHYANLLIASWDGKSKGTKHMIELAKSQGLKVKVIYF